MGKYDPLEHHLRRQKAASYEMSFRDVERTLGRLLPRRAHSAEWWANPEIPDPGQVQCLAWLKAGFRAIPQTEIETVRFERASLRHS